MTKEEKRKPSLIEYKRRVCLAHNDQMKQREDKEQIQVKMKPTYQ